jgi:hypothetical protein
MHDGKADLFAIAATLHLGSPAFWAIRQQYAPLFQKFSMDTNTMRYFFAQQDRMQVFNFVLECLDVFQDICLLLWSDLLAG